MTANEDPLKSTAFSVNLLAVPPKSGRACSPDLVDGGHEGARACPVPGSHALQGVHGSHMARHLLPHHQVHQLLVGLVQHTIWSTRGSTTACMMIGTLSAKRQYDTWSCLQLLTFEEDIYCMTHVE